MVQMMMWNPKEGDKLFMETMRDFATTYRLQSATTEDFKAIVEKHMSPAMDLDHDHRMDWFFNQYVYGTDLPAYHFESQVTPNDNGVSVLFKLTQSGVLVTVFCGSSWRTTLTCPPDATEVKSITGGPPSR